MSIRFKFRSSVNFDSVDMEGQPWLSVADLRSKIAHDKNLNISQHFDLIFSDAVTGHEYNDENFHIPSGSSVIIKRVPAGSLPSAMVTLSSSEKIGMKDSKHVNPLPPVAEVDNFDDFGIDLCLIPEAALSDSNLELNKRNCMNNEKPIYVVPRVGCQKLETSDLSEATPKGHSDKDVHTPRTKVELNSEELMRMANANYEAAQNADLPSELKCSVCNTFFKDAVMIPCCQHSFCQKCICVLLLEKGRCPKCSSRKCGIHDLLPNLSLRQAIEHFLESQNLMSGADSALHKDAPDGESGIQAIDASCAVTVRQKGQNMPVSSSATEKGSNQVVAESFFESQIRNNVPLGGSGIHDSNLGASKFLKSAPSHKLKQIDGERVGHPHHVDFQSGGEIVEAVPDFQGESQPNVLPHIFHDEVDSSINQKTGVWVNKGGGDRSFMATGRPRKGDRTCYMCGSPYHFIRDCPAASSPHPMLQTGNTMFPGAMSGYTSPFWNSTSFPPIRPFTSMYGNSGMMLLNSAMVPPSPFAVPPYMPSMYGGSPALSGFMRMGGMAPQVRSDPTYALIQSDKLELQDCEKERKLSNEQHLGRGQHCDDADDYCNVQYHHNELERSHGFKSVVDRERSASYSDDSFTRISQKKQRRDKHLDRDSHAVDERHEKSSRSKIVGSDWSDRQPYHQERSNSGVDDMLQSYDRHSKDRLKHHHRSSKKYGNEQCGSESSWSHHQTKKERDVERRKRDESAIEGLHRKHHSHSKSGLEPSSSVNHKKLSKDEDSSHTSRHSRHKAKALTDDSYDRWQMASGSEEDCRKGNCYHKRKRVH